MPTLNALYPTLGLWYYAPDLLDRKLSHNPELEGETWMSREDLHLEVPVRNQTPVALLSQKLSSRLCELEISKFTSGWSLPNSM